MVGGKGIDRQRVSVGGRVRAARQAVLATTLLLLETGQAQLAQAGLSDWRPVFANYSSKLTMNSSYTTDDRRTNRGPNQTSTVESFRQTLDLSTVGYVYHPDLMLFRLFGKHGEDQNFHYADDINGESKLQSKGRGGFDGYDLESKLFRAKPYILQLSKRKDKPFLVLPSKQGGETREDTEADFKYRIEGQRVGLKYHNTTTTEEESLDALGNHRESTNAVDDFSTNYSYLRPKLWNLNNFTFTADSTYQEDATTSAVNPGGETVTKQGSMANSFGYSILNFNTSLSGSTTDFDDRSSQTISDFPRGYSSDTFGFNEGVNIRLPWDFSSNLAYSTNTGNSTNTWTDITSDLTEVPMLEESTTNNDHFGFLLRQSLYDSLNTEFSAKQDSSTTSRLRRPQESAANPDLVDGIGENKEYGLETRYRKLLPHNSTATGSLSSRNVQNKDPGLNLDHSVPPPAKEFDGIIRLNDFVDTSDLTVDVLKDDSTICRKAASNPALVDLNHCWLPLTTPANYTIDEARNEIKIGQLSDVPELDYLAFNAAGGFFTFRVNSHHKAADYTSQTDQFTAGLILFQVISTDYQHTMSNQDGTSDGRALVSDVVSDRFGVGLSLYDWSFHASQQWMNASDDTNNTSSDGSYTDLSASYGKSRKFWERLTVTFNAGATKGWGGSTDNFGADSENNTEGYLYSLTGDMPLPYIKASLRADHNYNYTKGQLHRLEFINNKWEETQDSGINEQTTLRNSLSLNKPFRIPWIDFAGSAHISYRWQTQTTIDVDGVDDGGKERSYLAYGLNAGHGWQLGSTTINLSARYTITEDIFDENAPNTRPGTAFFQRDDQTNNTSVMLTVVRQLF